MLWGSGVSAVSGLVMPRALRLAPADDPLTCERALSLCYDRVAVLGSIFLVGIDDDPVAGTAQFVCAGRVGEEHSEVPIPAAGMHDRQPGFARRIEPLRSNTSEFTGFGLLPVEIVGVQKQ